MDGLQNQVRELTLLLLYLNSWTEKDTGFECRRSWKGFDFDDLNALAEKGFISEGRKTKSVVLYEKGMNEAEKLLKKYNINSL